MSRRTLESHGQFFVKYLRGVARVLDCGCGPGTITLGIASVIAPGVVTGGDRMEVHCHSKRTNAHSFYARRGYEESPKYFLK